MPSAAKFGIRAEVPAGWSVAIKRRAVTAQALGAPTPDAANRALLDPSGAQDRPRPVVHMSNKPLPDDLGDFGGTALDGLGADDAFVALLEFDPADANQGLFARQGMPKLAPSQFAANRMARYVEGQSASQHFFSLGGRAFCLYAVIGSHSRRMAVVPNIAKAVASLNVTDIDALQQAGIVP